VQRRTVQPLLDRLCTDGHARAAVRLWRRSEKEGASFFARDYAAMLEASCRSGDLALVLPLLRRLRDGAEERLACEDLDRVERGLAAARLPSGSKAFEVQRVTIASDDLGCAHCGTPLSLLTLNADQRALVRTRLRQRAAVVDRSGFLVDFLQRFADWLLTSPSNFDCVIDGPNVGYEDQNYEGGTFNYYQVEDLRQELQLAGMQPLIVMPSKYMPSKFEGAKIPNHTRRQRYRHTELSVADLLIIEHWRQLGVVYEAEVSGKDDWLWMYASLLGEGRRVVTNDEMRDHWLHLLEWHLFRRWKESQIIHFDFKRFEDPDTWQIELTYPKPWTRATQTSADGTWHIACADDDSWVCARPLVDLPVEAGAETRWLAQDEQSEAIAEETQTTSSA